MPNNYRIGMLIGRFYPVQGGAELQCRRLAIGLKNENTFILTQKLPHNRSYEIIDGLSIYRVGLPFNNKFGSFTYLLSGLLWILRNKKKFDLLHAHIASAPAILAGLVSILLKKPSILKIAGSRKTGDVETSSATFIGKLKLAFLKRSIKIFVCPSNEIKQELLKAGFNENKIKVIANGVDIKLFRQTSLQEKQELRQKLLLPEKCQIVIFSGRLENGKGLDVLINAWKNISSDFRENAPNLLILGSGSHKEQYEAQCRELKTVTFRGWKDNIADFLAAGDVFVLPSFGEGLPNSLLEAMSCGLSCIATRIGGVTDIITSGQNGILVSPGNADELYAALKSLINERSRFAHLGINARKYVESNLALDAIVDKYRDTYAGAMASTFKR